MGGGEEEEKAMAVSVLFLLQMNVQRRKELRGVGLRKKLSWTLVGEIGPKEKGKEKNKMVVLCCCLAPVRDLEREKWGGSKLEFRNYNLFIITYISTCINSLLKTNNKNVYISVNII